VGISCVGAADGPLGGTPATCAVWRTGLPQPGQKRSSSRSSCPQFLQYLSATPQRPPWHFLHRTGANIPARGTLALPQPTWTKGYQRGDLGAMQRLMPFPNEKRSGPGRIRTCDTRPRKPLLYPLSYRPVKGEPPRDVTVRHRPLQTVFAIICPPYKLRRT
jgi:hypothetical protein